MHNCILHGTEDASQWLLDRIMTYILNSSTGCCWQSTAHGVQPCRTVLLCLILY
jgi:hypothetical protein